MLGSTRLEPTGRPASKEKRTFSLLLCVRSRCVARARTRGRLARRSGRSVGSFVLSTERTDGARTPWRAGTTDSDRFGQREANGVCRVRRAPVLAMPREGTREREREKQRMESQPRVRAYSQTSGEAPLSRGGVPVLRATSCVSVLRDRNVGTAASHGAAAGACMCDRGKARRATA